MSEEVRYRRLGFLGFPKHRVSSIGHVYARSGRVAVKKHGKWKPMKLQLHRNRKTGSFYLRVMLTYKGRYKMFLVHRLVLRAFKGRPPKNKPMGCHNDNDTMNNFLSNLRWDHSRGNQKDRKKHGTTRTGNKYGVYGPPPVKRTPPRVW
jgi:hypothetical protein